MKMREDQGVLYVAFGYWFVLMATHSAVTLARTNPGLPVSLITNVPVGSISFSGRRVFNEINVVYEGADHNRAYKLSMNLETPYEKTIFLDCDTVVRGDLTPLFDALDWFNVAIKMNGYPGREGAIPLMAESLRYYGLTEYNSGVIAFRKKETSQFFESWRQNYQSGTSFQDQVSLAKTIYESKGVHRLLPLSAIWNLKPESLSEAVLLETCPEEVKIVHYREVFKFDEIGSEFIRNRENFSLVWSGDSASDAWREEVDKVERMIETAAPTAKSLLAYRPKLPLSQRLRKGVRRRLRSFGF